MYPCKYRPPSTSSLDSCEKEKLECVKQKGKPCFCRCPRRLDPYQTCKNNLRDITDSIGKILELIGIKPEIVNPSKQLIFALFHHYDYGRWSYEPKTPEKVCKDHVMHIFMKVFDFERIESELAYYVTKRAFKAYFGNKCKGIHNPALDAEITAQDTGTWRHAARTTSRIIEEHELLLPRLDRDYNKKILRIYINMCQIIKERANPLMVHYCNCDRCAAVRLPVSTDFEEPPPVEKPKKNACKCGICSPYKGARPLKPGTKPPRPNKWEIFGIDSRNCEGRPIPPFRNCLSKKTVSALMSEDNICLLRKDPLPDIPGVPWCDKCKMYKMICDCHDNGNRESQGPFETEWIRDYNNDDKEILPGHIKDDPENHHCPIDCADLSLMSDTMDLGGDGGGDGDGEGEEEEDEDEFCHCCDDEEDDEEEETDDEEKNANFVQPYCYCQKQDDVGI